MNIDNKLIGQYLSDEGLSYKESKNFINLEIKEMQVILKLSHAFIKVQDNNKLEIEDAILRINELTLNLKTSQVDSDPAAFKPYKNGAYESLMKFLIQKEEKIKKLQLFVDCFNEVLSETERKIIYHSFFRNETNVKLTTTYLQYCLSTTKSIKREATIKLAESIILKCI